MRNKSQHERGRTEVRSMRKDGSPPTVDLKLIEGKVVDILKKQTFDCSAFSEASSVQRVH